jgi:two-component system nitrate/nitrite response regulator NarL
MGRKSSALSLVPSARRARVIVADPYPVILCGVRKMVEDDPRFQVVAEASTMPSFRKKVIAERPDVALVDWFMASQDLAATTALIDSDLHSTSVIFLTVSENSQQKQEMLRLGVGTFVSKWSSARRLQTAVLKAYDGRMPQESSGEEASLVNCRSALSTGDAEQRIKELTHRERQLIPLVCSGLKNKEIARQLGIAESTVWHHLTAVFNKLRVGDRLGLVTFAYCHRLVLPDSQARRSGFREGSRLGKVGALQSTNPKYPPTTDFGPQLTERVQP